MMVIVLQKDLKELRQSDAFRIMLAVCAVITAGGAAAASIILGRQAWLKMAAARPLLELIIALIIYFLPLFVLLSFIWAFASLPLIKEKVNGNIECLLATPLSPQAIWMGKCLAIFLPGYLVAAAATLVVVLAVNLITIVPATGIFVLPLPALLTGILIIPLLFSGLLALIVIITMAGDPDLAIAPSFLVGFGLMIGIPLGMALEIVDPVSWPYALWHLAGATAIWVVVCGLSRFLKPEKIILSGKGD